MSSPNYSIIAISLVPAAGGTSQFVTAYDFDINKLTLVSAGTYTVIIADRISGLQILGTYVSSGVHNPFTVSATVYKVIPTVSPTSVDICTGNTQLLTAVVGFTTYEWFKDGVSMGAPSGSNTKLVSLAGTYTVKGFLTATGLNTPSVAVPVTLKPVVTGSLKVFKPSNITIGPGFVTAGTGRRYNYTITGPEEVSAGVGSQGNPLYLMALDQSLITLAPDDAKDYLNTVSSNFNYEDITTDGTYQIAVKHQISNCPSTFKVDVEFKYLPNIPVLNVTTCTTGDVDVTVTNFAQLVTDGIIRIQTDTGIIQGGTGNPPLTGIIAYYNLAVYPVSHPTLSIEHGISDGDTVFIYGVDVDDVTTPAAMLQINFC
jgi:hypothetical protein